uniref:Uncharacterized protein n=2 Tax=Enterobacteriaceae TaxID=543 RepID=A0A2R4PE28_ECOLX|nr:hypothetical protein [Escherichia coli]QCS39525.1 hypothetical protein [Klebsiella pneumoniae]UCZ50232.1 hypothetical protein [Klebsiella michiganensis]
MISGLDTQILTTACGFNGGIPWSVHYFMGDNMPQSIFQ